MKQSCHIAVISTLLLLAGCGGSAARTPQIETVDGRWFCQTTSDDEGWDCVQDEALAANPKPDRLPQPRQPQSTAIEPPIPAPPPEPVAAETDSLRDQSPIVMDPELPPHVALAYRPESAVSLLDLPDKFWAVQLLAVSSKAALEDYARKNNLRGMSAAEIVSGGSRFYILLLGIYETRERAERAVAGLPPPFDDHWIRSLGSLKQGMLEAERTQPAEPASGT